MVYIPPNYKGNVTTYYEGISTGYYTAYALLGHIRKFANIAKVESVQGMTAKGVDALEAIVFIADMLEA
jgi:hypothetical protein